MNNLIFLVSASLEVFMSLAKKFLKGNNDPVKQESIEKVNANEDAFNACIYFLTELKDQEINNITAKVLELINNDNVKLFCLPGYSEVDVKIMGDPIGQIIIVLPQNFSEQAEKDMIHQAGKVFLAFSKVNDLIRFEDLSVHSLNEATLSLPGDLAEGHFLKLCFDKNLLFDPSDDQIDLIQLYEFSATLSR